MKMDAGRVLFIVLSSFCFVMFLSTDRDYWMFLQVGLGVGWLMGRAFPNVDDETTASRTRQTRPS